MIGPVNFIIMCFLWGKKKSGSLYPKQYYMGCHICEFSDNDANQQCDKERKPTPRIYINSSEEKSLPSLRANATS